MTSRKDYTTPEWNILQTAMVGVGFYMHRLTPGFIDGWRAKREAEEAIEEGQESGLLFFKELCDMSDFKTPFPKNVKKSNRAVESFLLQSIDEALNILADKDPALLPAYKSLLLEIAHETADEVDGISDDEKQAINKINNVIIGKLEYADSWRLSEPFANKPDGSF